MSRRPAVAFIAWSSTPGRSQELSAVLGGEARCFYDFGIVDKRFVPLRYLASAVRTVAYLASRRPRAVIVTTPPVFPALIAYLYCRLAKVPLVLDSHPLTFGFSTSRALGVMRPLNHWLIRRAAATMVTAPLRQRVVEIGGTPVVMHEAPPTWEPLATRPEHARPQVLYVTIFASDEPYLTVVDAARAVPEADVLMTGDVRKAGPELTGELPANVRLTGFLDKDAYVAALRSADVVVALTDRAEAVSRVASEAVWAERPLVITDWPVSRELFPAAAYVANDPASVAEGIRRAIDELPALTEGAAASREQQFHRWEEQLQELRAAVPHLAARGAGPTRRGPKRAAA